MFGNPIQDHNHQNTHGAFGAAPVMGTVRSHRKLLAIAGTATASLVAFLLGRHEFVARLGQFDSLTVQIACAAACAALPLWAVQRAYFSARDVAFLRVLLKLAAMVRRSQKPHITVADVWERAAQRSPSKDFVVFEDRTYTYAATEAAALQVAAWAESQGLKSGEVVLLLMENRPEFIITWLGLCKLGVTTALLNTNLREKALLHCIREAKATLLITGPELLDALQAVVADMPAMPIWVWHGEHSGAPVSAHPWAGLDDALAEVCPQNAEYYRDVRKTVTSCEPHLYIYTSGTTGLPKASKISHARFNVSAGFTVMHGMTSDERWYCTLPLYHSAGGQLAVTSVIYLGATLVLRRKFSASQFWKDCVHYRVSVVSGQPTLPSDCHLTLATDVNILKDTLHW